MKTNDLFKILVLLVVMFQFTSCDEDVVDEIIELPIEKNDCSPYITTARNKTFDSKWEEVNESDKFPGEINIPADPGGGYVTVSISTTQAIPWLTVSTDISSPGAISSGSAAGTSNEQFKKTTFSVHPSTSYGIEAHPFFNAPADQYPLSYTIKWEFFSKEDCFEPNDNQAQAKQILLNETIEAYAIAGHKNNGVGAFDPQTYDWYKVVIKDTTKLQAETLQSPSDVTIGMRFFKENGSTVSITTEEITQGGDNKNGQLIRIYSNSLLLPGTYYLEVHPDFVASRKANDNDALPDHFRTKYKLKVTDPQ